MTAADCFKAGKLEDAIAAAASDVKSKPADHGKRGLLAELLCFAGELERADKHLSAIGDMSPEAVMGVGQFRQLIRAEQARQDFYAAGRVPHMLTDPTPVIKLRLEAAIEIREGRLKEAAALLQKAQQTAPTVIGRCDGKTVTEFRDLDDQVSDVLEVFTGDGRYFWIPMETVESISFEAPRRPRDLLWRQAQLSVRSGPDGVVFVPALYPGSAASEDEAIQLGRSTQWLGEDGEPVRGLGLRMFLVGEEAMGVTELTRCELSAPAAASPGGGG